MSLKNDTMLGTDDELLREYASRRSPEAFDELARRHADWVYSAASRMMRDPHLAQDVTQAVFLLLSQQPHKAVGRKLHGWLFRTTRFTVANIVRSQRRQRELEQHAAIMALSDTQNPPDELWRQVWPLLDELIARLREKDQQVVLLRFYQGKSLAEVGEYLGISEEAARKRVNYALERLRAMFEARGIVAVGGAALAVSLSANATHAAPAAVLGALSGGGAYSASASAIAGTIQKVLLLYHLKVAAIVLLVAAISLTAAGSIYHFVRQMGAPSPDAVASSAGLSGAAASGSPGRVNTGHSVDNATFPAGGASNSPPTIDSETMKFQASFQLGSSKFLNGDQITISSIRGSSEVLAPGNSYVVTGTYTLASQQNAMLALYTSSSRVGVNDNGPYGHNFVEMHKGSGAFSLELYFRIDGYPHVSIYPTAGGDVLGSLYFGSGKYVLRQQL
jgi:RNA polymerase sigma factor (sigma-70 family)